MCHFAEDVSPLAAANIRSLIYLTSGFKQKFRFSLKSIKNLSLLLKIQGAPLTNEPPKAKGNKA
jgi:hypothetical protein